jgi:anaerobic nitric oxide reductase transcription regulator
MLALSACAVRAAEVHEWPGNVRELRQAVWTAVLRAHADGANVVQPRHLFPGSTATSHNPSTLRDATMAFQRLFVQETLAATQGNKREAILRLGIARSHFYRLFRTSDSPLGGNKEESDCATT